MGTVPAHPAVPPVPGSLSSFSPEGREAHAEALNGVHMGGPPGLFTGVQWGEELLQRGPSHHKGDSRGRSLRALALPAVPLPCWHGMASAALPGIVCCNKGFEGSEHRRGNALALPWGQHV